MKFPRMSVNERGQAMSEFALVMPILVLLMAGMIMAGIFVIVGFLYVTLYFKSSYERGIQQQLSQIAKNDPSLGKDIITAVVEDRKSLFAKDLLRSLFFVGASFLLMFFYLRGKIKAVPVMVSLLILVSMDTIGVASRYLNSDIFIEPEDFEGAFTPTPADLQIKQDPDPHYRVLNLTTDFTIGASFPSINAFHPLS